MMTPTFSHKKVNGIYLHVGQAGPEEGPLVLLLHGFPECWYGWRHQIDFLVERGYRVWIPDQRGYNLSDKPPEVHDYGMQALVDDVVGLIQATGEKQARIVGHDWGAMVAWWMALYHPERVERMAVLNAPHPQVMQNTLRRHPTQALRSWYTISFQMPYLPEKAMALKNWRLAVQFLKGSALEHTFTDADIDTYREAWSQPGAMRAMMNWYRSYVRRVPPAPADWQVKVPTRIIWGKKDVFLKHSMAVDSVEFCDSADVHLLEDATHWVQHDEADRVNWLLEEFLQ